MPEKSIALGHNRSDRARNIADRHCLEVDLARTSNNSIEQTFAAEQYVTDTLTVWISIVQEPDIAAR